MSPGKKLHDPNLVEALWCGVEGLASSCQSKPKKTPRSWTWEEPVETSPPGMPKLHIPTAAEGWERTEIFWRQKFRISKKMPQECSRGSWPYQRSWGVPWCRWMKEGNGSPSCMATLGHMAWGWWVRGFNVAHENSGIDRKSCQGNLVYNWGEQATGKSKDCRSKLIKYWHDQKKLKSIQGWTGQSLTLPCELLVGTCRSPTGDFLLGENSVNSVF